HGTGSALALGQHVPELVAHGQDGLLGGVPVDAGIGDGNTVLEVAQILGNALAAPAQMAFHHQADDRAVAVDDLVGDVFHDQRLQGRVLVGVGMAAVD